MGTIGRAYEAGGGEAERVDHRVGCSDTQLEEHFRLDASQSDDRVYRTFRIGKIITRLRYDLRRGTTALCGEFVGVCAAVLEYHAEAGRGRDHGALAGYLDRPEIGRAQSALDGRDDYRNL